MANTRSAAKNARKAIPRHEARVAVKSRLKTLRKKTLELAKKQKTEELAETLRLTIKSFDKAASNKYIHPRTAARKIGRLCKQVHKLTKVQPAAQ